MARGFKRSRGMVRAKLDDGERALLAHLFVEVFELLDDGPTGESDPLAQLVGISTAVDEPSDPALARLLPDGRRDDPDAASELRRYTELGLRDRKRAGLERARVTLGRGGGVDLDEGEAQAWVVALTDVRLVLGARMGLVTDEDHERVQALAAAHEEASGGPEQVVVGGGLLAVRDDDPAGTVPVERLGTLLMVYDFVSWFQETLVTALLAPRA
jgi:hypothetical protein